MKDRNIIDLPSPRSSETHFNDKRDKRCAPGKRFEDGSCIPLAGLIKMALAYNKENDDQPKQIKLYDELEMVNPKKYKRYLLREFKKRFSKCTDQRCWLKQSFTQYLNEDDFDVVAKNSFRPDGPNGRFEWLNTIHIADTMTQYEHTHTDFKFIGAVPIDFDDLPDLGIKDLDFDALAKDGKTKLGFIFNLDEHYKSGSHWVSMYADIKKGQVYFSDSVGVPPPQRVRKLIRRICRYIQKAGKKTQIGYNKTQHQYDNSECGVYSINFILKMLSGENFETVSGNRISDNEVNKCRKVYFNNPEF